MRYLWNQFLGLRRVASSRVKIDDTLRNQLKAGDRSKLDWVIQVKEFSAFEMGLESGDAYTTYYDTGGGPINYTVIASHPLALVPYLWHFPIAGTVPYKGYFDPAQAADERKRLLAEGWDAALLPVEAFSTLGWFSDPVLSTMFRLSRGKMAELLIHELTHRTLYFPDHSMLNESLATVVGRIGAERILQATFGENSDEIREYREEIDQEDLREEILNRLRGDLDALYRSRLPVEAKLNRKQEIFRTASLALWRTEPDLRLLPTNALLILDREYRELNPKIQLALSKLGGEPRELIARLKSIRGSADPLSQLLDQLSSGDSREGTSKEFQSQCAPSSP